MRIVETFSGIGSQAKAVEQLSKEIGFNYEIVNTVEWDINSIYAYDIIHNGPQENSVFDTLTKEQAIEKLSKYTLSYDGKNPIDGKHFNRYERDAIISVLKAIKRSKNLVSIKDVNEKNFPKNIDVLTYSFPCQDLSLSGYFHGETMGIKRDANNSSSLLWEIERILLELNENKRDMPRVLVMENVQSIMSSRHIDDFNNWRKSLEQLGYINKTGVLNAYDFGIPQQRTRAFMISVYFGKNKKLKNLLENKLNNIVLDNYKDFVKTKQLDDLLKLDYSNPLYYEEAKGRIPNNTPSRVKIYNNNLNIKLIDGKLNEKYVRTITTRQDRHPNSCVIDIDKKIFKLENSIKSSFRYLTARESFLLMGFDEHDYNLLLNNNLKISNKHMFLTNFKLTKMAGNSIVVNVIKEVFRKVYYILEFLKEYKQNGL